MNYRRYTPTDFAELYAIEEVCFKPPLRFSRRYMRAVLARRVSAAWIAEEAGRMRGFGIVDWLPDADGVISYIQTIEVLPEARRMGIGRGLMDRMEESAITANSASIWLHVDARNQSAIRLYEGRGYRYQGSEKGYYGVGRPALVFAKQVNVVNISLSPPGQEPAPLRQQLARGALPPVQP